MNKYIAAIGNSTPKDHPEYGRLNTDSLVRDVFSLVTMLNNGNANRSKLARALTMGSALLSVSSISKNLYDFVQRVKHSGEYTVKVPDGDRLFNIAERWLMAALPEEKKLSIYAKTIWETNPLDPTNYLPQMHTYYDGSIEQEVEIAGYTVRVSTKQGQVDEEESLKTRRFIKSDREIIFTCPTPEARDAIAAALQEESFRTKTAAPGLFNARWGDFHRVSNIPKRPIDSVFLKEGQMERIIDHLTRFRENKESYQSLGIPWRTGIMFYGEPGTGKSSTAAAIANEFGMNLYNISLRGIDGDGELAQTASKIPENSIVLFEDIDVCTSAALAREGDSEPSSEDKVSMSALLNVLDGFQSPEGVIFIMTTNKIDTLDNAIKRPGRIDLSEELSALDNHQFKSMVEYYTGSNLEGKDVPVIEPKDGITSADVVKVIRQFIPNVSEATQPVLDFAEEKLLTSMGL